MCDVCGNSYKTRASLGNHVRRIHKKNSDVVSYHEESNANNKATNNDDEDAFPEDSDMIEVIDDLDLVDALVEAESTPTMVSFTTHTLVAPTRPTTLASMVCHQLPPTGPARRLDGQSNPLTLPPPSSLAKSSILPDSIFKKVMENMEEEDFSDEEGEEEEPNMFSPPPHAAVPGLKGPAMPLGSWQAC